MKNRNVFLALTPLLVTVPHARGSLSVVKRIVIDMWSDARWISLRGTSDLLITASETETNKKFISEKISLLEIDS